MDLIPSYQIQRLCMNDMLENILINVNRDQAYYQMLGFGIRIFRYGLIDSVVRTILLLTFLPLDILRFKFFSAGYSLVIWTVMICSDLGAVSLGIIIIGVGLFTTILTVDSEIEGSLDLNGQIEATLSDSGSSIRRTNRPGL